MKIHGVHLDGVMKIVKDVVEAVVRVAKVVVKLQAVQTLIYIVKVIYFRLVKEQHSHLIVLFFHDEVRNL
ncbi:MAG: hypothetical protein ACI4PK_03475 [Oscillospiraceae bacterium]